MTAADVGYRRLVRPVLFRAGGDAEAAHHRTLAALTRLGRHPALLRLLGRAAGGSGGAGRAGGSRTVFGVDFPGPVGLAAGADKDGVALAAWPALGFGFIEAGTVTAVAQQGNPRPRVFRLPESGAVVNRMGFPNQGAAALAARIRRAGPIGVPLGVSIGKSKIAPLGAAVSDYLTSLRAVEAHADYVAVNVSSPNTPGLRGLQDRTALDELIAALVAEARSLAAARSLSETRPLAAARPGLPDRPGTTPDDGGGRRNDLPDPAHRARPLLVKIAPDLTDHAIADILSVCHDRGAAGVIATNTTVARSGIASGERGLAMEAGGFSGSPLAARARAVVRFVAAHTDLPVIGVGGIATVDDALAMFDAGASLVQIYTGLLYRGPGLVSAINRAAPRSARPAPDRTEGQRGDDHAPDHSNRDVDEAGTNRSAGAGWGDGIAPGPDQIDEPAIPAAGTA